LKFFDEARATSAGKLWQPRALLLLICSWIFYRHLQDPMYGGIVKGLNLAIHEIGHVLFGFFGSDFLAIAGGTILQLAAPIFTIWMFYRQRDFFAIAIAFCWLGTNLFDVAVYAAHDWFVMLAETNLLYQDKLIAGMIRAAGIVNYVFGLVFGVWILRQMRAGATK
jgi:hypothetical protein